jgi:hypothetical protein
MYWRDASDADGTESTIKPQQLKMDETGSQRLADVYQGNGAPLDEILRTIADTPLIICWAPPLQRNDQHIANELHTPRVRVCGPAVG